MKVFAYSITYVTLLFGALTLDVLVRTACRDCGSWPCDDFGLAGRRDR